MRNYKVYFQLVNGEQETAYFTENPVSRINDWIERTKCDWVRLEGLRLNLCHVASIKVAKLAEDRKEGEEEIEEWL